MPRFDRDRFEIELISSAYLNSRRIVQECAEGTISCPAYRLEANRRIVAHIENVISSQDEQYRYILEKEVLEGKRGKWFLDFVSAPTYYRERKRAYAGFLRCL